MMRIRYSEGADSGFSMTELAVAIVVLGIVLVGLFPLVIDSLRLAVQNAEVAQANRIVATQLDISRDSLSGATCAAVTAQAISLPASDSSKFAANRTVTCDGTRLATVTIQVQRLVDTSQNVATATTRVVTAASTP